MASTCLRIIGLALYAHHGVFSAEQQLGGRYEIDAELWYNATEAERTDDIGNALNYATAITHISHSFTAERFHLLEAVAHHVSEHLFTVFPLLTAITLRIRKLNMPVSAAFQYIEVERRAERATRSL
jgi:7,8-dihydroneopterin aldolase/epimerase/oxygenase